MSLLMWNQVPDEITILTDTLATDFDGNPSHFQTKCWPMPQLRLVIAGTGFANFIDSWHKVIQNNMLTRDITMLNDHAPKALRKVWEEVMSNPELPDGDHTATLYHFGTDEESEALVRYTYRSTTDFEPEYSPDPSFAVKPVPETMPDPLPDSIDKMVALACEIRAEQDALPKSTRIHIGGELILTVLQGTTIASVPVHRFDDYDAMWNTMNTLRISPESDEPSEIAD